MSRIKSDAERRAAYRAAPTELLKVVAAGQWHRAQTAQVVYEAAQALRNYNEAVAVLKERGEAVQS